MHAARTAGPLLKGSLGLATLAAFSLAALGLAAAPARAQLVGTTVTGSLVVPSFAPFNLFDPTGPVRFVPATGYENSPDASNSPTVTVSGTAVEFGFDDTINLITADLTDNGLTLTDVSGGSLGSLGFPQATYTFTDSAFAGLSLSTLSNTFPAGFTAALSGTTLTINTPSFFGAGTRQAVFSFGSTAVPEPSQTAALGLGALGLLGLMVRAGRRRTDAG